MNHAASHLENRKVLQGVVQNGRFLQTGKREDKEIIGKKKKKKLLRSGHPLLQGGKVSSFFMQITSCWLTEKCTT